MLGLDGAPSTPMDAVPSARSCPRSVACQPCRTSKRAILAQCVLCSSRQHSARSFYAPRSPRKPSFPQGSGEQRPAVDLRVPLVFLEINPSCAQWKLLLHVLEVLVAETINADQGTGLGVTDVLDCC